MNKMDFLSPPITLFHLERRTHTSKTGGCLVLLMLTICISYTIFLLYNLVSHKKMTSIFHKRFEFEAGYYSFNSSSIFHFIQIFSPDSGGYFDKYDSKYIRAFTTYVRSDYSDDKLQLYDHWVFDQCRKDIDDKGLEPHLFSNVENFTNGICIRHYYNSKEKKYYSSDEEGFVWPHLEHGISQRNNIYLTTIVQKCSNDSVINNIFGKCPSQKEIDDYLKRYFGIYLYFTDYQVDPTNYSCPIQKYLQVMTTGIGTPQTFVESYIHFAPLKVKTTIGSLFEQTKIINSFYFDFNRKGSANNNGKFFTITKYYHLMQNNVQIYERKYDNVIDLLSEIGGVIQFIFYFFYWINYIYNKYIILYDVNSLFFSMNDKSNIINKKFKVKFNESPVNRDNMINIPKISPIKSIKNNNKINESILKKQIMYSYRDSKFLGIKKNNDETSKEKNRNLNFKNSKRRNSTNDNNNNYFIFHNSSNLILKTHENNLFPKSSQKDAHSYNILDKNIFILPKKTKGEKNNTNQEYLRNICLSRKSLMKIEHKMEHIEEMYNKQNKAQLTFIDYIKSIVLKNEDNHHFLSLFRKHLLSEEHLLKSHISMVLLEKKCISEMNETTNVYECYNEL